jgi:hypothetical protein
MRNLYIVQFLFVLTFNLNYAQNNNDINKISLSIIMPENLEGLDNSNLSKLESKISNLINNNGLSGVGYRNNFVIYPKFAIYESKTDETGMKNLISIDCELSLFIKQIDNNLIYSSISISLSGYGNTRQLAISNAIQNINTGNEKILNFIDKGKKRIVEYYESRCNDFIIQADGLSKRQSYEEAITLLLSIPSEVSCFSKVQSKTIEIYKSYQSYRCVTLLQNARAQASQNDYSGSLNYLSQIDPSSKCGAESKDLMTKIEGKIDEDNRQRWQAAMMIYKDVVQLEKQRINAVRDIAVEYARNQPKPPVNNYLLIIK